MKLNLRFVVASALADFGFTSVIRAVIPAAERAVLQALYTVTNSASRIVRFTRVVPAR